jgi:hypothetical protein
LTRPSEDLRPLPTVSVSHPWWASVGEDDRGYADIPVTASLTDLQIAEQLPALGLRLGDHRPHVRGKLREYLPL